MLTEITQTFAVDSEITAKDMIEQYRTKAKQEGYVIKKASYEYKTKKSNKEIIAEKWVVKITQIFGNIWEDIE